MPEIIEYASREQVAQQLAGRIAGRLTEAVAARGRASLVVSGGSSPVGLFRVLAATPLPWSKVVVLPSDERWVPPSDKRSNEGTIHRELIQREAKPAGVISLYRRGADPETALADINAALVDLPRPLDTVVLGMGEDGHTASLFPNAPDIEPSLASTADAIAPQVGAPRRVSLTLHCLCNARHIDLLFFGEAKRRVLAKACEPGPTTAYPVRGVLSAPRVSTAIHWAR